MRIAILLAVAVLFVPGVPAEARTIDFPCFKNLTDGRVLVDGMKWDQKLQELGFVLDDGAYVPYKVLRFSDQKTRDQVWADGICNMLLLPPRT